MEDVFNPYRDRCSVHDRANAPAQRRANLRAYLNAVQAPSVRSLWVGRDLGYRGGRRTGLPLTDEAGLAPLGSLLGVGSNVFRQATYGAPLAERTAADVRAALARAGEPVAFWNVFPLHPHQPDEPLSNRAHSAAERDLGLAYLQAFIDLLGRRKKPQLLIVAVGGDAQRALARAGYTDCQRVRHPSYGGKTDFLRGISALYRNSIRAT